MAFPQAQVEALLPEILVRELPAGTTVYRPGDPAENLYIIESGGVDLLDPQQNHQVLEHMGPKSMFGRLSFLTDTPRATEALTRKPTRLLILPRRAFLDFIEENANLWEPLAQRLKDQEVLDFLRQRQGMSADAVTAWAAKAVAQARAQGRFEPAIATQSMPPSRADLVHELVHAKRTRFFAELPAAECEAIAARLIVKTARAGHTFFHIGEPGHRLYLLRRGKVALLDPHDPSRRPQHVQPGEVFGRYSFFTDGAHTVAAVAAEDSEVIILRRRDFDALLLERPGLQQWLAAYLRSAGVADYLTRKQDLDTDRAARWLDQAVHQVQRGDLAPSLLGVKRDVGGHGGAAVAILLGMLLDGVPEALVVGAGAAAGGAISIALLGSIFISNFPEAMSSAAGMREQGFRTERILAMWFGLMLMTGIIAGLGALTMASAPEAAYAVIEGFAAGAMLTVVAETMLPEAYQRGGGIVGLSTLPGFLVAVLLSGDS